MNVINHLSTLETAGLVRLAQVVPDLEYLFRHVLVQDAVYASLLHSDQKRLHREVGEALEWLYPDRLDELAPTLARHYKHAGDRARALQYYQRAAATALGSFANQEAELHYRSALGLDPAPQVQSTMYAGLGEALYNQSRFDEATQVWKQAINLYRQAGDTENVARLFSRSARAAWYANDKPRSLEIALEGLQMVANASQGPGVASLLHETARAYWFNSQFDKAEPLCRQALELAERLDAVDVQADSLTTLGIMPGIPPDEAIALQTRAVELAESAGLLNIATRAHINLGSAKHSHLKDVSACRWHYLRSAELAHQRGALQEEIFALAAAAHMLTLTGELDELERSLAELDHLQANLPNPSLTAHQLDSARALMLGMRGEWAKSLEIVRRLRANAKDDADIRNPLGYADFIIQIHAELKLQGQENDPGEVQQILDETESMDLSSQAKDMKIVLLAHGSCFHAAQSNTTEARRLLEYVRQNHKADNDEHAYALLQAEVELAAAEKRLPELIPLFNEFEHRMGNTNIFFQGRFLIRWAEACMLRGDPDDLENAQAYLEKALGIFQKIKNPWLIEHVQQMLKSTRDQTLAQAVVQKKVAKELAQAGRIQGSFLPANPPQLAGWQIAVGFQPARQTSGDFYDFIPLPDGKIVIAISDVADKGMGAALYMASARSLLRAYAVEHPNQPVQVIEHTNQRLTMDTHGGLFVTLFYGVLDPNSGELLYVNAGHNPPYLFHSGSEPVSLTKTGIPLGIFDDVKWEQQQVNLKEGDMLVLYTDGVTEAIDAKEVPFDETGLVRSVNARLDQPVESRARVVCQGVQDDIAAHRGATAQTDDITLMVISRQE